VEGFCEHDNEDSFRLKRGEFARLCECWFVKEASAPFI